VKPKLYALNVGRGDSFFLEFQKGDGASYFVLMDGGDERLPDFMFPLRFMQKRGIRQVDLLILTHLHHDHVVGLLSVAKQEKVVEAVLPYPKIEVDFRDWEPAKPKAKQSLEILQLYNRLYQLLEEQQTTIRLRPPFGEQTAWPIGEWKLRHLAPVPGDELPAYQIIRQISDVSRLLQENVESLLSRFDDVSNYDSSIWLLEHGVSGEQIMLFGGDALLPVWERVLQREKLSPVAFKVSHHGMNDGVDSSLLERIKPDWLLVTNRETDTRRYFAEWNRLATGIQADWFVTGEEAGTKWLFSELPGRPVRVK
jgi:beta-lactamase superfamily II metal-dependent hydrolase